MTVESFFLICNDYELGLNAFTAGDLDSSVEFLQKAIETDPEHWEARRCLALVYKRMGLHFKSQRAWRYIAERCPEELIRQYACEQLENARGPVHVKDLP